MKRNFYHNIYNKKKVFPAFIVSAFNVCAALPSNVGITLVADVAATTLANDAYWAEQCKTIPASTLFLVLDMGTVRDFFKPTEGSTYCEMLQAHNKHQWSPNGVDWVALEFYSSSNVNGGSADGWPRDKGVEGDARKHLSFWGRDYTNLGGCCSSSTAVGHAGDWWAHPFTLSYALPLHPLPPNTGMSLVANVAGTTVANDAYWSNACQAIPPSTLFLVLDMGTVRDFFKPTEGSTYCEMLQSHDKHQWSANGEDWVLIPFYVPSSNGGSMYGTPEGIRKDGDKRAYLSSWGTDSSDVTGGCCSSSLAVAETYPSLPGNQWRNWGQHFTVSYSVALHPLPPNVGMSLVADVAGTTVADDVYWWKECQKIPDNALFIVVDMGAVRDFFKPGGGMNICQMLQSDRKHQWSADGIDWVRIDYITDAKFHNGGSANGWPKTNGIKGDARNRLSFWGYDCGAALNKSAAHHDGGCSSEQPCGQCTGDCDGDAECKDGLACFQRSPTAGEADSASSSRIPIPGCRTGNDDDFSAEWDYCYDVDAARLPTGRQTGGCCSSSTKVAGTFPSNADGQQQTSTNWGQSFTMSYGVALFLDNQELSGGDVKLNSSNRAEQESSEAELSGGDVKLNSSNLAEQESSEAEAADDFVNVINNGEAEAAVVTTPSLDIVGRNESNGSSGMPGSRGGGGAAAAGIVMPLIGVGAVVAAYFWKKRRAKNAEAKQRNDAEANELRGRGAMLEMVPNPMLEFPRGSATAAPEVYYSEIADGVQRDADGYVDDGSIILTEQPAVYATYASSASASDARPYAALDEGSLYDTSTGAPSADGAGAEARPYSVPFLPASEGAMYAAAAEKSGVAYASSGSVPTSPVYGNSSMMLGGCDGDAHAGARQGKEADAGSSRV